MIQASVPASAVASAPFTVSVIELPGSYGREAVAGGSAIVSQVASVKAYDLAGVEIVVKDSQEPVAVTFPAPEGEAELECAYYDEVMLACCCFCMYMFM